MCGCSCHLLKFNLQTRFTLALFWGTNADRDQKPRDIFELLLLFYETESIKNYFRKLENCILSLCSVTHKMILLWLSNGQHFSFLNTWMRRLSSENSYQLHSYFSAPHQKGRIRSFCLYSLWLEDLLIRYKVIELDISRIKLTQISAIILREEVLRS